MLLKHTNINTTVSSVVKEKEKEKESICYYR